MSLVSAIMTATSTQCTYREDGGPDGSVTYRDYGSPSALHVQAYPVCYYACRYSVGVGRQAVKKVRWV